MKLAQKLRLLIQQKEFSLPAYGKGFHIITDLVGEQLPELPENGLLHLFIKHTSAGLAINESHDPNVLKDFSTIFGKLAPEDPSLYIHTELRKAPMICPPT